VNTSKIAYEEMNELPADYPRELFAKNSHLGVGFDRNLDDSRVRKPQRGTPKNFPDFSRGFPSFKN
jgi:hypothetical protein